MYIPSYVHWNITLYFHSTLQRPVPCRVLNNYTTCFDTLWIYVDLSYAFTFTFCLLLKLIYGCQDTNINEAFLKVINLQSKRLHFICVHCSSCYKATSPIYTCLILGSPFITKLMFRRIITKNIGWEKRKQYFVLKQILYF